MQIDLRKWRMLLRCVTGSPAVAGDMDGVEGVEEEVQDDEDDVEGNVGEDSGNGVDQNGVGGSSTMIPSQHSNVDGDNHEDEEADFFFITDMNFPSVSVVLCPRVWTVIASRQTSIPSLRLKRKSLSFWSNT